MGGLEAAVEGAECLGRAFDGRLLVLGKQRKSVSARRARFHLAIAAGSRIVAPTASIEL